MLRQSGAGVRESGPHPPGSPLKRRQLERVAPSILRSGFCHHIRLFRKIAGVAQPQEDSTIDFARESNKTVSLTPQDRTCHLQRRRLIITSATLLWLLWFLGQIFRDSTWLTGLLFYMPSPVLLFFLLGCCCCAWRANHRGVAGLLAGLALVPAILVLCVENRLCTGEQDTPDADTLRLVHWNVFRGHLGWDGIENDLQRCGGDLYVLSEIPKKADAQATATSFGRDFSGIRISNLAVVARGSLQEGNWLQQQGGLKAYGVVWQSPQGNCRVLVVDLASSLRLAREPRLLAVRKLMVDWHADIVVGDFNAPRRSRALSPLPPGFVHAYEAVGSGCSYTWPLPCPVYAIDQCILGQRIWPVKYDLESSLRSDHRRQVLDFAIEERRGNTG